MPKCQIKPAAVLFHGAETPCSRGGKVAESLRKTRVYYVLPSLLRYCARSLLGVTPYCRLNASQNWLWLW